MHVYKHAQPALLYLGPACLDNTLSSLLLLILFPQEFPSGPRWWGETSSQCSSMRIIPTLRRRRPTRSLPAHYQCLSSSRSLFETKCDNLLSYRDTLLPANLLSSVNIFSPSHAEHIWYFQPSVHCGHCLAISDDMGNISCHQKGIAMIIVQHSLIIILYWNTWLSGKCAHTKE